MPLDTEKIDDAALALLFLTLHDGDRAWKVSIGMCSVVCMTRA